MSIGLLDDVAAELDYAETMHHALRSTERDSLDWPEVQRKHGSDVDLSGLGPEYVSAYETGERVTVERDGREYRGTIGATRGPRPRFVLLLSMDL